MKDFLKRFNAVILITMLIMNSAGYTLVYFQLKYVFRQEAFNKIENYLNDDELTYVKISYDDIENSKNGFERINDDEFVYNGNIYDVAKMTYHSDGILILCYEDESETKLEELFKDYLSDILKNKTSLASSLLNQLINEGQPPADFYFNSPENICGYPLYETASGINTYIKIPTPPPKYIS
ncbi:MAG TPA: hypothetical protein PK447_01495 [Ignavibacteria bacterium]|nr:hypothetical protein [Ignavibacteria bacterium]